MLMIKPYYRELVKIMMRKSMYPPTEGNSWSLDDKEVFRCYRQDIADTFVYCYVVLNTEMMEILNTKLDEALHKGDINRSTQSIQWNEVETVLYAFAAIAESIDSENLYLPKIMKTIKEIPFDRFNFTVMNTALEALGKYKLIFLIFHRVF